MCHPTLRSTVTVRLPLSASPTFSTLLTCCVTRRSASGELLPLSFLACWLPVCGACGRHQEEVKEWREREARVFPCSCPHLFRGCICGRSCAPRSCWILCSSPTALPPCLCSPWVLVLLSPAPVPSNSFMLLLPNPCPLSFLLS